MSGWTSWLTGKPQNKNAPREAIVGLRSQLLMLEKQEEHLNKKIDDETRKAKAAVSTNKQAAQAALRRKKQYENQLERIYGTRMTLETQVNAIESANMNLETMQAMRKGAEALKTIHGSLNIDKVDATMDSIREQMDLTNEISDAISNPVGMGQDLDEDALKDELEQLEQEELNERLVGADHVPLHTPSTLVGPSRTTADRVAAAPSRITAEDDDEEELRKLQAEMAM
ncbi:ESCRT-III subunit protein snf7 [Tilletia horrida]|uniref:Vacuolar-sorting protein SNF7 n=1 Tax=Tilletia horrida TaxID=155126 RepID=A0AAN6GJQ7_9BASI|nr:ESCRT-III subunit protein snf7 [Tilletia horrida]KAK0537724.1 ESCRT-III subunit protein snf7 [Tilletia horrida]KAK0539090.1 ESCRT-III subunit protein snf7 [Tilletia horrida]KAK0565310.1 ESCRT-III subunit protein snf7 [Tilletia horrida]